MSDISIAERPMTDAEFARMNSGFAEHGLKFGNDVEVEERHGFVATTGETFVGCSSCLVYRQETGYGKWCFLTDLFVSDEYRSKGIGGDLLRKLETRVKELGVKYIYTWTAGYEAPGFYTKQGYEVFATLDDWYSSGHGRVGFKKEL